MNIVYPINETLMLRKARDARIMRMAASWATQGHKVYLIVGKNGASRKEILEYYGVEDLSNLEIIQVPILRKNNILGVSWNGVLYFCLLIKLIKLSRQARIDVLYLSVFKLASFLLSWKRWIRADRFVYEVHELGIYPEARFPNRSQITLDRLERKVLPKMDGVITTTKVLKDVLKQRFSHLPVAAIPLGTAATGSRLPPYSFTRKDSYNICYIGQLYDAQGVDLLIRASAQISEAHLHIIGGQEEEIARLKLLAKELDILERITFYGFVPPGRVQDCIQQMDVFVVPSRDTVRMNYVAHIKIYEYMSYGRPIVATSLRSSLEELRDGENAILVNPDDPQALANGVRRLIDNPELARKITAKASEMAPSCYWGKRAKRIEQFILELPLNHQRN